MALQFYGNGRLGEVWIEDHRPDGSVVMLVCTEGAIRKGARSTGPDIGVVESSAMGGGAYPYLREKDRASRLPTVHVNTTDLPGGIQRFAMKLFGRKALETAERGVREVALSPSTAPDWGWIPAEQGITEAADHNESRDYPGE